MRYVQSWFSPHYVEVGTELHPVLLVIYSEHISDVNTNVDHVDALLHGQIKLVVVWEDAEVPVGHPPTVLLTDQVRV